jgi:hypothetical protein
MFAPLLIKTHVSLVSVPLTPKLAVATVGGPTDSTADADAPPYEPLIVAVMVAVTTRVETVNVAVLDPAGTVTVAGTVTGVPPDNDTTAPPAGAALLRVAVPFTEKPPSTLASLSVIDESTGAPMTVSAEDWLLPLSDAVIVAVPADIAVTVNAALVVPAATITGV